MFWIDYTLPRSSRYILFFDAPFRYAWRHLIQYFNDKIIRKKIGDGLLTASEKRLHFAFAFLEMLPILGLIVAVVDRILFYKKPKVIRHYSSDLAPIISYEMQKFLPLYMQLFGSDANVSALRQEHYILPRYIQEMKELSRLANVPYSRLLLFNTIVDRLPLIGGNEKSNPQTIISLIFDGKKKRLLYAFGSDYAASRPYKKFNLKTFCKSCPEITYSCNIDIPMALLSPFTRLFLHEGSSATNAFISVGWLGLIGCYFGINSHGLLLSAKACLLPSKDGTPSHLLFRQVLEEAKSCAEAKQILDRAKKASQMQVHLIGMDGSIQV